MDSKAIISACFVSIIWGLLPHLNKYAQDGSDIFLYLVVRNTVGVLTLLTIILFSFGMRNIHITRRMTYTALAGILSSIALVAYIYCLSKSESSVVTSFINSGTLLTTVLLGFILYDEKINNSKIMGIACAILACVLLK